MCILCIRVLNNISTTSQLVTRLVDSSSQIMATQLGTLNEFNSSAEPITVYLERVELYFSANSVAVNKQVATFLSVVGATVYSTLRDLFAPDSVKDKTLNEIFDHLKSHFEPKRTTIVEQYHFHNVIRLQGRLSLTTKLPSEIWQNIATI